MRHVLRQVFGIDERSLALLRIGLGLILLLDLGIRATSLTAHYTDRGVLPRAAYLELFADPWSWSLHLLSGTAFYQGALFVVAAAAAAALAAGYRTRLMTVISWVLLVSLHTRNPLVVNGGDQLLRMIVLWSIFLPLGRRASIDALRGDVGGAPPGEAPRDHDPRVLGAATAAILLQVLVVYVFSGAGKFNDLWRSGEAMVRVFSMDLYARPLATYLLGYPAVLHTLSVVTPWFEALVPLVVLIPVATQRLRLVVIAAMILFHVGIELTLHVGLFSLVAVLGWLVFLPPMFWDGLGRWVRVDGLGPRLDEMARRLGLRPRTTRRGHEAWRWTGEVVAALLLLYVAVWNVRMLSVPRYSPDVMPLGLTPVATALSLDQRWALFTHPRPTDGWYILVGERADGSRVELLTGKPFDPLTVRKPDNAASLFPDHRWRKYYRVLSDPRSAPLRPYLPPVVCRRWDARHRGDPLVYLEIIYIEEIPGQAPGDPPTLRQLQFYRGPCPRPTDIAFDRPEFIGEM